MLHFLPHTGTKDAYMYIWVYNHRHSLGDIGKKISCICRQSMKLSQQLKSTTNCISYYVSHVYRVRDNNIYYWLQLCYGDIFIHLFLQKFRKVSELEPERIINHLMVWCDTDKKPPVFVRCCNAKHKTIEHLEQPYKVGWVGHYSTSTREMGYKCVTPLCIGQSRVNEAQ